MKTRRMRWRAGPLPAVIAVSVLVMAGCGGGSSDGDDATAAAGSGASGTGSDRAVEYSECMRENGVPNFPDPENGRLTLRAGPGSGIDPESPEFKSAQDACRSKAPQGLQGGGGRPNPQMQEAVLRFAKCMRGNGVAEFPDPDVSGGGVRMQLPPGVDPNSQEFVSAQQKCQSLLQDLRGTAP